MAKKKKQLRNLKQQEYINESFEQFNNIIRLLQDILKELKRSK